MPLEDPLTWRPELHAWVDRVWQEFRQRPEVLGLAIGGSLGRGQEHPGSDLELGILVERPIPGLGYFQVRENRGVEAIQLQVAETEERIVKVLTDPTACTDWPVQLWRSRVVHDPTGLFARFGRVFEDAFLQPVTLLRQKTRCLDGYLTQREQVLAKATTEPALALAKLRDAFNSLVCAKFWHHGRIPRSQNRCHQRLSALCAAHDAGEFLAVFEKVYSLPVDRDWARVVEVACRSQRLKALTRWGEDCRNFFTIAVDPGLEAGDLQGITAVHRQYIPMIQGEGLDDPAWRHENKELLVWLDLAEVDQNRVMSLLQLCDETKARLQGPLAVSLDDPLA